jgi:hypothetical protein
MLRNNILNSQPQPQPTEDKSSLIGGQAAREILLLLTTASISPSRKKRISQLLAGNVDWRYLLDLAEFHNVAPLVTYNLTANGFSNQVPQLYLKRMHQIYNATVYRNVILSHELRKILTTLGQYGITAIVLKGTILAEQLYGNPGLRTVADMDILVLPEDLSLASSLVVEMGYKQLVTKQKHAHPFHVAYEKQGQFQFFIELHWDLEDQKLVSVARQEIWHRAQRLQTQGEATLVLSPEDNLLFLANHLSKQNSHLLRSLCDVTELLRKHDDFLDWNYIIESAHSWGIGAAVHYSLKWAKNLLGAPVPESAIRTLKPEAWRCWLLDFLTSQNIFLLTAKLPKLSAEIYNLVQASMMKHPCQMLAVLSKNRKCGKTAKWLRTIFWTMVVFGAITGLNIARVVSRWTRRVSTIKDIIV